MSTVIDKKRYKVRLSDYSIDLLIPFSPSSTVLQLIDEAKNRALKQIANGAVIVGQAFDAATRFIARLDSDSGYLLDESDQLADVINDEKNIVILLKPASSAPPSTPPPSTASTTASSTPFLIFNGIPASPPPMNPFINPFAPPSTSNDSLKTAALPSFASSTTTSSEQKSTATNVNAAAAPVGDESKGDASNQSKISGDVLDVRIFGRSDHVIIPLNSASTSSMSALRSAIASRVGIRLTSEMLEDDSDSENESDDENSSESSITTITEGAISIVKEADRSLKFLPLKQCSCGKASQARLNHLLPQSSLICRSKYQNTSNESECKCSARHETLSIKDMPTDCGLCHSSLTKVCIGCESSNNNSDCHLALSECSHIFHAHCVAGWLKSNSTCPRCSSSWSIQSSAASAASSSVSKDNIDIVVVIDDTFISMQLSSSSSIGDIYSELSSKHHYSGRNLLVYNDTVLHERSKSLAAVGIRPQTNYFLSLCGMNKHAASWTIVVKSDKKSPLHLPISGNMRLDKLKRLIQTQSGVAADDQILHLELEGSLQLPLTENKRSLASLGVDNAAAIQLTVKVTDAANTRYSLDIYNSICRMMNIKHLQIALNNDQTKMEAGKRRVVLYVNLRPQTTSEGSRPIKSHSGRALALQDALAYSGAWQPSHPQSNRGMSLFLSCLYMIANSDEWMSTDKKSKLLSFIKFITDGFIPAVTAFKILIEKRVSLLGDAEKSLIANMVLNCIQTISPKSLPAPPSATAAGATASHIKAPEAIDESKRFEQCRIFFSFIINQALSRPSSSVCDDYLSIPLRDPIDSARIQQPVLFSKNLLAKMLQESGQAVTEADFEQLSQIVFDRQSLMKWTSKQINDLSAQQPKPAKALMPFSRIAGAASSTFSLNALKLLSEADGIDLIPYPVINALSFAFPHGDDAPVYQERSVKTEGGKEEVKADASAVDLSEEKKDGISFLRSYSLPIRFKELVRSAETISYLKIIPPLSLMRAPTPSLTRDERGDVVIYQGRGKDIHSSTRLFIPLRGSEDSVNSQTVAQRLSALQKDGEADSETTFVDDRTPLEAVLICLDLSSSMNTPANFSDDGEEDEDDERETPPIEIKDISKIIESEKNALDEALKKFKSHRCFQDWRSIVADTSSRSGALSAAGSVMSVIMDTEENHDAKWWRTMCKYRSQFVELLAASKKKKNDQSSSASDSSAAAESVDESDDEKADDESGTPEAYLCPINRTIMEDPVVALDGFTYERSAIQKWFDSNRKSSPMTGQRLPSTTLTPNHHCRSQIHDWRQKRDAAKTNELSSGLSNALQAEKKLDEAKSEQMQICVSNTGKSHVIDCHHDTDIRDLKWLIYQKLNVEPTKQRLWFSIRTLRDGTKVKDYSLQNMSTIQLSISDASLFTPSLSRNTPRIPIKLRDERYMDIKRKAKKGDDEDDDEENDAGSDGESNDGEDEDYTYWLAVDPDDRVIDLKYRIYRSHHVRTRSSFQGIIFGFQNIRYHPKNFSLWNNLTYIGDGRLSGHLLKDDDRIRDSLWGRSSKKGAHLTLSLFAPHKEKKIKKLTRLEATKQLFHAFINRSSAYDYSVHLGLMLFSNTVRMSCPLTSLYENFRDHVDRATASGDTKLYDALDKAADVLEEWKKTHPTAGLRIVAISDGKDTASKTQPEKTASKLQRLNITVDAIQIGNERDQTLHALSKCTGGLIFAPSSLRDALRLLELETLLCQLERPDKPRLKQVVYTSDLNYFSRIPRDECSDTNVPKRRVTELTGKVLLLDKVLEKEEAKNANDALIAGLPVIFRGGNASSTNNPSNSPPVHPDRSKRIMREMKALHAGPHPSIDVYPSADEISKWVLIIEGPNGTPYANACWKVYLEFPPQYPNSPPTIRFLTAIKHCNISTYGRVCHSILDRNYTPDVTIKQILDCIYGLLLNPDVSDPLDSALALEFYDASGRYEAQIIAHSKLHAAKTRSQWTKELTDDDEDSEQSSAASSSSSESSGKDKKSIRNYNCAFCGKFFSGDSELLRCAGCQKACYCNRRCQSSHWKKHKMQCK